MVFPKTMTEHATTGERRGRVREGSVDKREESPKLIRGWRSTSSRASPNGPPGGSADSHAAQRAPHR